MGLAHRARARRAATGWAAAALCAATALLASAPPALADTLTTPAASTTYGGGSIPVAYSLSHPPQNDISLTFDYTSGPNAPAGATWTVLLAGVVSNGSFSMQASDPTSTSPASKVVSVTPSAGATGTSLPDGTYNVTLSYHETSPTPGLLVTAPTTSGVVIDTSTQTPLLTSPVASSTSSTPLNVGFTLPEPALAGSVSLTFAGSATRTLTLSSADETAGSHSLSINTASLSASPGVASVTPVGSALPDGTYNVTIAYQDQFGNPPATATALGVHIDTTTLAPLLTSPTAGTYATTLPLTYTLPEAGLAGSVVATLTDGLTTSTLGLSDASAGTHTVNLNPANLGSSTGVASVSGATALADGTYSVAISYRDALGNPAQSASVSNVVLQTAVTPAPATPTPSPPAPVATVAATTQPATLAVQWRSRVKPHRHWVVQATFKPEAGAASYTFAATLGSRSRAGECVARGKGAKARIVCRVTLERSGAWTLEATARGSDGTELAVQSRSVLLRARSAHHRRA